MGEITQASGQQEAGIKQINEGLVHIEDATQGLAYQVDQLKSMLEHFKKSEDDIGQDDDVQFEAKQLPG